MQYKIEKLDMEGWYDFSKLPQENSYVKINALNCGTDRKAINRAKNILQAEGIDDAEVVIVGAE